MLDRVAAESEPLGDHVIGLAVGGADDDLRPNPVSLLGPASAQAQKLLPLFGGDLDRHGRFSRHRIVKSSKYAQVITPNLAIRAAGSAKLRPVRRGLHETTRAKTSLSAEAALPLDSCPTRMRTGQAFAGPPHKAPPAPGPSSRCRTPGRSRRRPCPRGACARPGRAEVPRPAGT